MLKTVQWRGWRAVYDFAGVVVAPFVAGTLELPCFFLPLHGAFFVAAREGKYHHLFVGMREHDEVAVEFSLDKGLGPRFLQGAEAHFFVFQERTAAYCRCCCAHRSGLNKGLAIHGLRFYGPRLQAHDLAIGGLAYQENGDFDFSRAECA